MSNVGHQLLSGSLSGLASTLFLQPFDLLKTRVQQGDGSFKPRNTTLILKTTREIIAANGLPGLWRGTAASLARNVPGLALYMTSLTQLRALMSTSPYFARVQKRSHNSSVLPALTSHGNLLAGATTRIAIGFILNPLTIVKARFESNIYAYESLGAALLSVARLGPSELLRGFLASSLRDGPYAGLFIVFYEAIKRETSSFLPPGSNTQSAGVHGFSAASAGAIATMATHPFDVIKTKLQVRSEDRYRSFLKTTHTIFAQRGMGGFFDGVSLRLTRKVLSSAIAWVVYEGVLLLMRS